jgi:hypothetical protein
MIIESRARDTAGGHRARAQRPRHPVLERSRNRRQRGARTRESDHDVVESLLPRSLSCAIHQRGYHVLVIVALDSEMREIGKLELCPFARQPWNAGERRYEVDEQAGSRQARRIASDDNLFERPLIPTRDASDRVTSARGDHEVGWIQSKQPAGSEVRGAPARIELPTRAVPR